MNTIFTLDHKDYEEEMSLVERYAVRALICKNGLWAMQKSAAGDYKIPGGGVEEGESFEEALVREVREETGLIVIPDSIREIGEVQEIRKDSFEQDKKYIAHSLHYFCEVKEEVTETSMTENELNRGYTFHWERLDNIIQNNEEVQKEMWTIRDTKFLKWLKSRQDEFFKSLDFMKLGQAINRGQWQTAAMIERRMEKNAKDSGITGLQQQFTLLRQCINRKNVNEAKQVLALLVSKRVKYLNDMK
ncbi:MAG: NUDIX domain-containing protein [Lachnospiraceae bacterium]|nr:NUDIX domain-containing protein [Lachnospiraceae bacterium]